MSCQNCDKIKEILLLRDDWVIIVVNVGLKMLSSVCVFIDRFIQEDWEAGVPWTGQCWENNPTAHAQR